MSDCDWCEGAGCEECAPKAKAKKPAAAAKKAAPAPAPKKAAVVECDWCEGAGCEECQKPAKKAGPAPAKAAPAAAPAAAGAGAKKAAPKSAEKKKCDDCGGAGCFTCEPEDEEEPVEKKDDDECWCGGEGCDDCGGAKSTKTKKKATKGYKCDFCEDAGCPACDTARDELTPEIALENAFYEAGEVKNGPPAEALIAYKKVIDLAAAIKKPNDDVHSKAFKSMEWVCVLNFKSKRNTEFKSDYKKLLAYIPKVTADEARKSVEEIVNSVGADFKLQEEVFDMTRDDIKQRRDTELFSFFVNMKQVGIYMDKRMFREADVLLNKVHLSCRLPDGRDDTKGRAADLVDIYAQKISIQLATGNAVAVKELERRTIPLLSGGHVLQPKSQAILRECFGKMYGDDGDWAAAKNEFQNAFNLFYSAGLRDRAASNLKYTVVATMLDDKKMDQKNFLEAPEAKQFVGQPDVAAIAALRKAYETNDVEGFISASAEIERSAEAFLSKHLGSMIRDFQGKAVVQLCKSYRRVRLDHLARSLKITTEQVENILIQLILDGDLGGVIDQVGGLLDLSARTGGGAKKYAAIDQLATNLLRITESLEQPVS